jgi:hypothetical protein
MIMHKTLVISRLQTLFHHPYTVASIKHIRLQTNLLEELQLLLICNN